MFVGEPVTLVMYHYVRDLANSRFPGIKGLSVEKFEGQLDYIQAYYNVVSFKDLLAARRGELELPVRSCLLTFDDAIDHYQEVVPRLVERGLTGMFCPVTQAMGRRSLLDVHKLHFVLASVQDERDLLESVFTFVQKHEGIGHLNQLKQDYESFQNPRRYDSRIIAFVKQALQFSLLPHLRSVILDVLYHRYVGVAENILAGELYLAKHHLKTMLSCGMEIGGHGRTHRWLNHLGKDEQRVELAHSLDMLKEIGAVDGSDWVMCYPFSGYSTDTLDLLREMECSMALTAKPGLVYQGTDPLQLPRLDTNDLPFAEDEPICEWTSKACSWSQADLTP